MLKRLTAAVHESYGQHPGCVSTLSAMAAVVQCQLDNDGYGPCISLGRGVCRCKDAKTVETLLHDTQSSAEMKLQCGRTAPKTTVHKTLNFRL